MDSDGKKLETKYPEQLTCWGHLTDTQNWQMEDKQKVLVEEYLVTWKAALNFAKLKKKILNGATTIFVHMYLQGESTDISMLMVSCLNFLKCLQWIFITFRRNGKWKKAMHTLNLVPHRTVFPHCGEWIKLPGCIHSDAHTAAAWAFVMWCFPWADNLSVIIHMYSRSSGWQQCIKDDHCPYLHLFLCLQG